MLSMFRLILATLSDITGTSKRNLISGFSWSIIVESLSQGEVKVTYG